MEWLPDLVFLGYQVRRPWDPGPAWAPIERVCCVGHNLCEPPEGWANRWDFNRAYCYATPEEAWATVEGDRAAYRLFAYFLLPVDLYDGEPPALAPLEEIFTDGLPNLPSPPAGALDVTELGYDVAEHRLGYMGYPYSPLVTSGFSHDFPTNRYGLLDDLAAAVRACGAINDQMPEHAPPLGVSGLRQGRRRSLATRACRNLAPEGVGTRATVERGWFCYRL